MRSSTSPSHPRTIQHIFPPSLPRTIMHRMKASILVRLVRRQARIGREPYSGIRSPAPVGAWPQ
jgi:hypothetical protein